MYERAAEIPNGIVLLYVHPLRMLERLGVELTPAAQAELVEAVPEAATGSDLAFVALSEKGAKAAIGALPKQIFGGAK